MIYSSHGPIGLMCHPSMGTCDFSSCILEFYLFVTNTFLLFELVRLR